MISHKRYLVYKAFLKLEAPLSRLTFRMCVDVVTYEAKRAKESRANERA